jgi:catechol 2,3-dioxygenase
MAKRRFAMNSKNDSLSWRAPLRIGRVTLTVRDLAQVSAFYQDVIGLHEIARDGNSVQLGAGGYAFLELQQDTTARLHAPQEAGLFHTAFLLPTRGDLANWVKHIMAHKVQLQGASDHLVSEAFYLADPEGNGIEVYADKPSQTWQWKDGAVAMATIRLDVEELLSSAKGAWNGAPDDTFIGHVHLQSGDLAKAKAFYEGVLGYDLTTTYPGANFYSTGGYHHHLATNIWNSKGAGPRHDMATGLKSFEIVATNEQAKQSALAAVERHNMQANALRDPWNVGIEITAA